MLYERILTRLNIDLDSCEKTKCIYSFSLRVNVSEVKRNDSNQETKRRYKFYLQLGSGDKTTVIYVIIVRNVKLIMYNR